MKCVVSARLVRTGWRLALSIRETDKVLGYVQNARDYLGMSVVFNTHTIRHTYPIADHVVVFWKGETVADVRRDGIERKDLENLVINGPAL